jgi:hypothetical protein
MSRAAEIAREASETHALVKNNAEEGQGDEQSSRDGKGSVWNSHAGEKECRWRRGWWAEQQRPQGKRLKLTRWLKRMPIEERVMRRAAEMAREASETHMLVKRNADGGEGDEQSSRDHQGSVWNSHAG